jgi:hypothetical protein
MIGERASELLQICRGFTDSSAITSLQSKAPHKLRRINNWIDLARIGYVAENILRHSYCSTTRRHAAGLSPTICVNTRVRWL